MKNFVHDEERKPEQTTCFYLLTDSGTKPLDDLLEKIADGLAKHDKCKNFEIPDCTITEDCLQLTCSKTVLGKEISLKMKVNRYVCLLYLRSQFSLQACILRFAIVLKTLVIDTVKFSIEVCKTIQNTENCGLSMTARPNTKLDVRNVGGARVF